MIASVIKSHKATLAACFAGYVCQAIVNNFAPLLFVTFQSEFGIPLSEITLLVTVNFAVQLIVDIASAKLVDRIGYRAAGIVAHVMMGAGFLMMGTLPSALDDHFAGLLASVIVYSVGGGLVEVMLSPLVESCPTRNKSGMMNLLHSFYCWGCVFVIGLSTIVFEFAGIESWRTLACVWAALPLLNAALFALIPIPAEKSNKTRSRILPLLGNGMFWVLIVMMFCAGAGELAVAQWASAFAESGLGVSKAIGDLIGPCLFAVVMGAVRVACIPLSKRFSLSALIGVSAGVGIVGYLMVTLVPDPGVALAGCAVCGASCALMWPGTFSLAAKNIPSGGTAMFALLAVAGDLGCTTGPTLVGFVSDNAGGELKTGILAAVVFPACMLAACILCRLAEKKKEKLPALSTAGCDVLSDREGIVYKGGESAEEGTSRYEESESSSAENSEDGHADENRKVEM